MCKSCAPSPEVSLGGGGSGRPAGGTPGAPFPAGAATLCALCCKSFRFQIFPGSALPQSMHF